MDLTNDKTRLYIEPFKIPLNKLLFALLGEFGFYFSLLIFIVTLAFVCLGFFFGYKFFILALLWLFIVVPLICFYLYIFHVLKPLTVYNSLLHSLEFKNNEIYITTYHKIQDKKTEKGINENVEKKETTGQLETKIFYIKDFIIGKMKNGTYGMSLFFNSPQQGILMIPYFSFRSGSDLETFKDIINTHLSN